MLLTGATARLIADEVGVTIRQVERDVAACEEQWRREAVLSLDRVKARLVAELRTQRVELWAAWERSKTDKERSKQKAKRAPAGGAMVVEEVLVDREGQAGDPRFMDAILRNLQAEAKIFGILSDNPSVSIGEINVDNRKALVVTDRTFAETIPPGFSDIPDAVEVPPEEMIEIPLLPPGMGDVDEGDGI